MSATASRGWLVTGLVLALTLLLASVAMVATAAGHWAPADAGQRWGTSQTWPDHRGGPRMMDGGPRMMDEDDWPGGRAGVPDDCLDLMRGREGR